MLNVNSALYKASGVDINSVNSVSNQILKEAASAKEPNIQAIDYSKFNRKTLGIDLYSSRTNSDLQKQIAMTQAGLYAKAINVAQLNSFAAANLYSASTVAKNVEMTQSVASQELAQVPKLEIETSNKIELYNTSDKKSQSSNYFNPFEMNEENLSTEESEKDSISLFA